MPKPRSTRTAPAAISPASPSASFCRAGFRQPAGILQEGDPLAGARRPAHRPRPKSPFGRRADRVLQAAPAPCRAVGLHDRGPAAQAARAGDRAARGEHAQRRRALRPPKVRFCRPRSGRRDAAPSAHDPAERQPGVVGARGLGNALPPAALRAISFAQAALRDGGPFASRSGRPAMTEFALARCGCPPSDGSGMQRRRSAAPHMPARAAPERLACSARPPARSARLEAGSAAHGLAPILSTQVAAVPIPRRRPNSAVHALHNASPAATFRRGLANQLICQIQRLPPPLANSRAAARPARRAFRRRRAPLPRHARSAQRQARDLRRRRARPTGRLRTVKIGHAGQAHDPV